MTSMDRGFDLCTSRSGSCGTATTYTNAGNRTHPSPALTDEVLARLVTAEGRATPVLHHHEAASVPAPYCPALPCPALPCPVLPPSCPALCRPRTGGQSP